MRQKHDADHRGRGLCVLCQQGIRVPRDWRPWISDIRVTLLWEPAQSPQVPSLPWNSPFFLLQSWELTCQAPLKPTLTLPGHSAPRQRASLALPVSLQQGSPLCYSPFFIVCFSLNYEVVGVRTMFYTYLYSPTLMNNVFLLGGRWTSRLPQQVERVNGLTEAKEGPEVNKLHTHTGRVIKKFLLYTYTHGQNQKEVLTVYTCTDRVRKKSLPWIHTNKYQLYTLEQWIKQLYVPYAYSVPSPLQNKILIPESHN